MNSLHLRREWLGKTWDIIQPFGNGLAVNPEHSRYLSDADNIAISHFHILRKREAVTKNNGGDNRSSH
ncbi:hypothetical protein [Escherichia coli]|uniref:hypothetical protein n=1 Tax=Escherichia coli TaxID=562 RepID=UPI001ADD2AF9|nr:hypothetical protein [Escherichia coli]MBO9236544.1 hypothetical protein [Escherichia coli]